MTQLQLNFLSKKSHEVQSFDLKNQSYDMCRKNIYFVQWSNTPLIFVTSLDFKLRYRNPNQTVQCGELYTYRIVGTSKTLLVSWWQLAVKDFTMIGWFFYEAIQPWVFFCWWHFFVWTNKRKSSEKLNKDGALVCQHMLLRFLWRLRFLKVYIQQVNDENNR